MSVTEPISTPLAPVGGGPEDPAAAAARRHAAREAERAAEVAAIKEKGFRTYVEELEKEKIEKMREELLRTMGLTEEDLEEMTPEARAAIEKRIESEIQKRLAAASLVNDQDKKGPQAAGRSLLMQTVFGAGTLPGGLDTGAGAGVGRDTLLAVQEVGDRPESGDRTTRERDGA
ncbi:hypothetical protein [Rhodospira trueperi]|uniref:Uncharacterized protein n=1 Tax=Rhodospira trueperi TaxID=69960 RepID=A0A1G7CC63_9PROT|nr:hypothetical protein [Rhodospira trueperi]SDE36316.1 hypothetical protein SAMN05421720_1062 [Rhodospira trueperi]